jgi:hypothetical protein
MGGSKPDNSASIAAAKQMQEQTDRMMQDRQRQAAYDNALDGVRSKRAQAAQQQMNAPLQMIQPPQPLRPPAPTQPAQAPQSQSAQVNAAANPMPQGSYGSAQQAKMAALGTGAGAATMSPVNAARPAVAMTPQLNSFNAPEINNLKFGGA